MLAVDDVADASDREAERDAGRRRIRAETDRKARRIATKTPEHAADRSAPDRDAAGPDEEDLQRIRHVVLPGVDDVDEAGADDPEDDAPGRDRRRVFLRDATANQSER